MKRNIKLAVGFIVYGQSTQKYLAEFLPSLSSALRFANVESQLWAFDNMPTDQSNVDFINKRFPDIEVLTANHNIGFGRAYNQLIAKAVAWGADYFLIVNPDTYWAEDALANLLAAIELNDNLGSVAPKVYRWDFANDQTTKLIDTCGIVKLPGLRFVDSYQGQVDCGDCTNVQIIGPSGCAGLYRLDALEQIKIGQAYFDEMMFMYKEDCDLAMRLRLRGWQTEFVSTAHIWHDRTAAGLGQGLWSALLAHRRQQQLVKEWSLKNQLIIYYKYWRQESILSLCRLFIDLSLRLLLIVIFDRGSWLIVKDFWSIRKRIQL